MSDEKTFLDDGSRQHQVLMKSGSGWTVDAYIKDLLKGKYAGTRVDDNTGPGSPMYAYDYLKGGILSPNRDGESTTPGLGWKKAQIDYYLYMKICFEEGRRLKSHNPRSSSEWWNYIKWRSILTKYDDGYTYDDWENFHPEWHLRWQISMMRDVVIPDFHAWSKAGQPYSWDPRVEESGDPSFDGSLEHYQDVAGGVHIDTDKGALLYYFVEFYFKIINNHKAFPGVYKLTSGFGLNEYVGFFACAAHHQIPHPTLAATWNSIGVQDPESSDFQEGGNTIMGMYMKVAGAAQTGMAGNWRNFLNQTAPSGGFGGGPKSMKKVWRMYLRALQAGRVASDLELLSKDKFMRMCFDFATEAKMKVQYSDKPDMSFVPATTADDEYKFPKHYRTEGMPQNVPHHVALYYGNYEKKPLQSGTSGSPNKYGPHVYPHGAPETGKFKWSIYSPEDMLNPPPGADMAGYEANLKDIYNDLNSEIGNKLRAEGTQVVEIELPDKTVKFHPGDAKKKPSTEASIFKKSSFVEKDYLSKGHVNLETIKAMMQVFKQKQPAQWADISRPRPLIDALPIELANAKIDESWSKYFHRLYMNIYVDQMVAVMYYKKGRMRDRPATPVSDIPVLQDTGRPIEINEELPVPFQGSMNEWGLGLQNIKAYGIKTTGTDRDDFIRAYMTFNRVAMVIARDTGIALTAWLGAKWMQQFFNRLVAKALLKGGDIGLTANDLSAAESAALGDVLQDKSLDLASEAAGDTEGLSAKEIKDRYDDFFKQCALLANMDVLSAQNNNLVISACNDSQKMDPLHDEGVPYDGRFWMLQDGTNIVVKEANPDTKTPAVEESMLDQNGLSTKVLVPRSLKGFESLNPAAQSMLMPMLRLYLVVKQNGQEKQIEFTFPQGGLGAGNGNGESPYERLKNMMNSSFDRGNGAGIKNCNITFEGTSPASARNDIKVNLELYFSTFADFFRERNGPNGKYSFSDLVVYPSYKGRADGRGEQGANEYNPSDYKIRMDVGWMPLDQATQDEITAATGVPDAGKHLADEIKKSNKSYLLNRVGEDISLNDDGSVNINIEFRAYVESLMKMNDMDALTGPKIYEMKKERQKKIDKAMADGECNERELKIIMNGLQEEDEKLGRFARRSIMNRLIKLGKIYAVDIDQLSRGDFRLHGFFTRKPRIVSSMRKAQGVVNTQADGKKTKRKMKQADPASNPDFALIEGNSKKKGKWMDENIGENKRINFFFMGDLIHILLDTLYMDEDGKATTKPNLAEKYEKKRIKLILGSFNYYDFDGNLRVCNIANIPVAAEYFYEWMTEYVVSKKRMAYPIMYFVRDLCNNFVSDLIGSVCQNANQESRVIFYTMPLYTSPHKGQEPFMAAFEKDCKSGGKGDSPAVVTQAFIDASRQYTGDPDDCLPLNSEALADASNMINYIFIYSYITPHLTPVGTGNRSEDMARGVHHFHIGAPRGMVKKMSFNKTDIAFLRESRFMSQGDLGLAQLGAVYNVDIDMIGNTVYYPGMECYVDPLGIGGTEFGAPNAGGQWNEEKKQFSGRSIANAMGFGGYHSVIKVKSQIASGKFNTTLTVQWVHSGDGKRGVRVGKPQKQDDKYKATGADKRLNPSCQRVFDEIVADTIAGRISPKMKERRDRLDKLKKEEQARLAEEQKKLQDNNAAIAARTSQYLEEAKVEENKKPE